MGGFELKGFPMSPHWSDALVTLVARDELVAWARTQPDYETAWATCDRGDWLLWLVDALDDNAGRVDTVHCAVPRPELLPR
jgi:hypothetical protein